jgi:hypothetical protein
MLAMMRFVLLLICFAMVVMASGCREPPTSAPPVTPASTDHSQDHSDHEAGPHGGTLTEWGGGDYHVEFIVDHDQKEATVYILGSDAKSPAPIKTQTIQLALNDPMIDLDLVAKPLEGEAQGTSSRFVGTHEVLSIAKAIAGSISGQIEGTPYTVDFNEEPHGAAHKPP